MSSFTPLAYLYLSSITSLSTTALLCSLSFAANKRVIVSLFDSAISFSIRLESFFSSLLYLFLNSCHLEGSWKNHFLSSSLGAMSFSHSSIFAPSFLMPLGHSLSTRILLPSSAEIGSYILLIFGTFFFKCCESDKLR